MINRTESLSFGDLRDNTVCFRIDIFSFTFSIIKLQKKTLDVAFDILRVYKVYICPPGSHYTHSYISFLPWHSPSASVCISYNSPLYWKQVALRDGKVWERKKGGLGWWTRVSLLLWEHLEAKGAGLFSFTEDIISFFIINPGNQDCCKDRWDSLHDCAVHLAGLLFFHLDI